MRGRGATCHEARPTIGVYLAASSVVVVLWAVSLATPAPLRFVLWGLGALVDIVAPIVATHRSATAPLHLEHLPERFGLLVILVLGEVAAAVVAGLHDTNWDPTSSLIAGTAFLVAVAAWWAYFDVSEEVSANALRRAEEAAEQEEAEAGAEDDEVEKVDERHDLFIYGHLPVTGGLLAAGVGFGGAHPPSSRRAALRGQLARRRRAGDLPRRHGARARRHRAAGRTRACAGRAWPSR